MPNFTVAPDPVAGPPESPPQAASALAAPTARPLSAMPRRTERRVAAIVVMVERGMALERECDTTASGGQNRTGVHSM